MHNTWEGSLKPGCLLHSPPRSIRAANAGSSTPSAIPGQCSPPRFRLALVSWSRATASASRTCVWSIDASVRGQGDVALCRSRPLQETDRIAVKRSGHFLENVFDINFLTEFARPSPVRQLPGGVLWSISQRVDGDLLESF